MKNSPLRRSGPIGRRKPIKPINRARKKRRHEERFGPQAKLCRTLPCCVPDCGREPTEDCPTHPHHWPTVANQGKDSDTSPLCFHCHINLFHGECGNPTVFLDRYEVDVVEVARQLAERIAEAS